MVGLGPAPAGAGGEGLVPLPGATRAAAALAFPLKSEKKRSNKYKIFCEINCGQAAVFKCIKKNVWLYILTIFLASISLELKGLQKKFKNVCFIRVINHQNSIQSANFKTSQGRKTETEEKKSLFSDVS